MEWIQQWWPAIAAGVGLIIWLIRLEAKVLMGGKVMEFYQKSCVDRHVQEKAVDTQNLVDLKRSIDKLFDLVRSVQGGVDEIRGWKEGIQKQQ
jgi:hypothetical protein